MSLNTNYVQLHQSDTAHFPTFKNFLSLADNHDRMAKKLHGINSVCISQSLTGFEFCFLCKIHNPIGESKAPSVKQSLIYSTWGFQSGWKVIERELKYIISNKEEGEVWRNGDRSCITRLVLAPTDHVEG